MLGPLHVVDPADGQGEHLAVEEEQGRERCVCVEAATRRLTARWEMKAETSRAPNSARWRLPQKRMYSRAHRM